jgi:exonuclease III
MNNFSLITFNIFGRNCSNFYSITNFINKYNPNIICTQEDGGNDSYKNIGDYKSITKIPCGTPNETNGVYEKNNSTKFIKCILSSPAKNMSYAANRSAFIFSYQNIIIANIHLEGGRFVDEALLKNFDKLMTYKIELLNMLLSSNDKPDIIVEDFNSVYHSKEGEILEKFLDGQYSYFEYKKGKKLNKEEKENIKMWNLAPILYMKKMGYEQAIPKNEDYVITNGRGNTIVDFIFYKKDKIKLIDCEIIDVMKDIRNYSNSNAISDHNPIFVKFKIIP